MTRRMGTAVLALWMILILTPSLLDAAPEAPRTPDGEVQNLKQQLERSRELYREGRRGLAVETVKRMFTTFEGSEFDQLLATRNHGAYRDLEKNILQLKAAMNSNGSIHRIDRLIDRIQQQLDRGLEHVSNPLQAISAFVQSFVIILREGLEALLILGAVLIVLSRAGSDGDRSVVYYGAGLGVVASVATAVALRSVLAFIPAGREVIEGFSMLLAVLVLFSVAHWLVGMAQARDWNRLVHRWTRSASRTGGWWTLLLVSFLVVYREGAETVLFYQALVASFSGGWSPILAGLLLGLVVLLVLWVALRSFGVKIPMRPFFVATSAFLYWMAFRFAGTGMLELQEAGWIPVTEITWLPDSALFQAVFALYPFWEPLLAQLVLVGALVAGMVYQYRKRIGLLRLLGTGS